MGSIKKLIEFMQKETLDKYFKDKYINPKIFINKKKFVDIKYKI